MLPFLLISYSCRNRKGLRNLLILPWAFLLVTSIQIYDTWHQTLEMMLYNSDWLFITVFPFMALYNGQRGKETSWSKYFFYIFYPAHLWIITLIAYLLNSKKQIDRNYCYLLFFYKIYFNGTRDAVFFVAGCNVIG